MGDLRTNPYKIAQVFQISKWHVSTSGDRDNLTWFIYEALFSEVLGVPKNFALNFTSTKWYFIQISAVFFWDTLYFVFEFVKTTL